MNKLMMSLMLIFSIFSYNLFADVYVGTIINHSASPVVLKKFGYYGGLGGTCMTNSKGVCTKTFADDGQIVIPANATVKDFAKYGKKSELANYFHNLYVPTYIFTGVTFTQGYLEVESNCEKKEEREEIYTCKKTYYLQEYNWTARIYDDKNMSEVSDSVSLESGRAKGYVTLVIDKKGTLKYLPSVEYE
ncbi:MAG TPA: hypothetical protein VJ201_05005 [Candidatus Babeliales bacterium]|nr:hypothetical protein [Candidatus Babeliales bacterium]